MKRLLYLVLLLGLISTVARGQGGYTGVTGTVLDPNGVPYVNSTISVSFYDPGTSGKLPLLNGSTFQQQYTGYATDGSGNWPAMALPDNGIIASSSGATGTQWTFNICYQTGLPCFQFRTAINCLGNVPATCTGNTINLSAFISALPPPILQPVGGQGSLPCLNLAYAPTLAIPVNKGNICYTVVLTGNLTISTVGTPANGNFLKLQLYQDAVGGHTVTFPANFNVPANW